MARAAQLLREEQQIRDEADRARGAYEFAMLEARHDRDVAISKAWAEFYFTTSGAYAEYRKSADKLDAFIDKALKK